MVKELTITPFLSKPEEFLHLADISRKLNQPHPTVRLHLNELEKEGILIKSRKGNLTLYKLNFKNPLLNHYIVIAEKLKLLETMKNLKLKQIISEINSDGDIIIFGSAAENFEKAKDIDILTTKPIKIDSPKKLHIIKVNSLNEVTPALKEEIMKKHIIIQETDRVVRWLYCQA